MFRERLIGATRLIRDVIPGGTDSPAIGRRNASYAIEFVKSSVGAGRKDNRPFCPIPMLSQRRMVLIIKVVTNGPAIRCRRACYISKNPAILELGRESDCPDPRYGSRKAKDAQSDPEEADGTSKEDA